MDQALAMLQRRGRVAYRTLKRQFNLDDDALEDLKTEIIKAQRLAMDEDREVLVWTGPPASASPPAAIPSPSVSAPIGVQTHTPLAYTPLHLAEKILTTRSALEGERKQVTVLFADTKGSMELIQGLDPEDARRVLDPAIHRMMDAVHRFEGTVNQVLGDGIMALFGAPIAHEDHALRACYAALAMQAAMREYTDEVRRAHGLELRIRVGLNAGEVVVRAIGNDLHMDYSAVGQTTHLAARMEQLATPGSIRLTAATLRLAEGLVQVNAPGRFPVKGLADPVEVFELVGASAIRRRLQASAARGLTRFVGRQQELAALQQALEQAGAGHGQVVAVVGEAGVGKSRLVYEFVHSHHTPGWLVLESASVSYGKATPYFPIIDLLKRYSHVEEHDDTRTIRAKVTGQVLTLDPALQDTVPALLSLLDALPEDSAFLTLDPPQRRQRTLDALKRVLLRESQEQPLLLVFEDLHWIDSETQALLTSLVESLPTARVLLLVNYRPEYQHGWGSKTYYAQLRLDPLPPASADEFLQALPTIQVPATVQAVLAARIDRLPPEEKRLLQTAAVIGTEVPLPLLQAIAELPEAALHGGLVHLQAAEFLYETRLFPEHAYTFKHALTHEVAYGGLLQERRRGLHARIVTAIEALYADRLAEQVDRLAHHTLRGEVWEKALTYCRQAGAKAVAHSANRVAVACFEQVLVALQHLPARQDLIEQAIDTRLDLRDALFPLDEYSRLIGYLREAELLAKTSGDQRRLGWVSAHMAHYFCLTGDQPQAVDSGQRALSITASLGEVTLQARAHHTLGMIYHALGDYRRAIDGFREAIASLDGGLLQDRVGMSAHTTVYSRVWLVQCLGEQGAFTEGIAIGEEAIQQAEAVKYPFTLINAYFGVGRMYLRKGDLQHAIPLLEQGLELCTVWNIPVPLPIVTSQLGYAYALSGRLAEALPLLQQAVERKAAVRVAWDQSVRMAWLSEAFLLAGRIDEAMELAVQAFDFSCEHEERGHEAWVLRLLGEIHCYRDPPAVEQADASYYQALALADELGMRPLMAHCHLGLGKLYATIGRRAEARAALSAAVELYRAMEMTLWLPQAEAVLAQVERR